MIENTTLRSGDPCYLVNLQEMPTYTGRTVEVVAPISTPPDESGDWYEVTGQWTKETFGNVPVTVSRCRLRPLIPPCIEGAQSLRATAPAVA